MPELGGAATAILIVEGDPAAALLASAALRRAGYASRVASGAREALELLSRKTFAAVLLHSSLPDGSPWTVLDAALAAPAPTPVIVVAGEGEEAARAEAMRRGGADFLLMSGSFTSHLAGAVDRAIRLAAAGRPGPPPHQPSGDFPEIAAVGVSLDGTVVSWNEEAERVYGVAAAAAIGRSLLMLLPPADPRAAATILASLATGDPIVRYQTAPRQGGPPLSVSLSLAPLPVTRHGLAAAAAAATASQAASSSSAAAQRQRREQDRRHRDLEREARHALEASRLKSEFLADMSHELRTPLNAIVGFAEMLHDGKAGAVDERQLRYLGHILSSSRHLLELLNDLLDLAKVEAGKMDFRPQRLAPAPLASEVIDTLRGPAAEQRIRVELQLDPAVGEVRTDAAKLKQILFNFLSNALKTTPPGGSVVVRILAQDEDDFRVEVEDTGDGIPPERLDRLFTNFEQLGSRAARQTPGTGLGLAVTKRLVEAQGGSVGARSVLGQGSLFFAILPGRVEPRPRPRSL